MELEGDNAPIAISVRLLYSILDHAIRIPMHSYEKELNGGARPALRLITTRDTPAGLHMVLCVSDITWSQIGVQVGEDGLPVVAHPTLELTDGWYRLRTRVDEILARAVRRGVIRVGRKIAISGASVRLQFSIPAVRKNLTCVPASA